MVQYKFKRKTGEIQNGIYVGPTVDFLEILPSKEFISKFYDNSIGKYRVTKWRFNSEENVFGEKELGKYCLEPHL